MSFRDWAVARLDRTGFASVLEDVLRALHAMQLGTLPEAFSQDEQDRFLLERGRREAL